MRPLIFIVLLVIGFGLSSAASNAQDAAKSQTVSTDDLKKLTEKAEKGDASAQFSLGLIYYNGDGVPQDYSEAFKWFHEAAEQGVADAQFNLGVMYHEGHSVPQDDTQAFKW